MCFYCPAAISLSFHILFDKPKYQVFLTLPCSLCADAAAYRSVACEIASVSTPPVVTDPSDDVFIWGRSRISLTEKLDVRGILISNNLNLTTNELKKIIDSN